MKKITSTVIALIVAALAAIQTQAADLESQLLGYWQADMAKTLELAKKEKREIDPLMQAMMGKMVFEFQKDKMIVHGPSGMKPNAQPASYVVSGVDKVTNSLTLSAGKKTMRASFQEAQLVLNGLETGSTIFNRMSEEDFAKRQAKAAGLKDKAEGVGKEPAAVNLEDVSAQPIPDKPAEGKIHGKELRVEKATLNVEDGSLKLRQGKDFFADLEFNIILSAKDGDKFDGKKFAVKPTQFTGNPPIHMLYLLKKDSLPGREIFLQNYTMYLEFGTAKDGRIPGKINLRVPDEARSFIIGTFVADMVQGRRDLPVAVTLEDVSNQPIPDKPAAGKVQGKEFKAEKVTLKGGVLRLWQEEADSSHLEQFEINLSAQNQDKLAGGTFAVSPKQKSDISIGLGQKQDGRLKSKTYPSNYYTMKLEFGAVQNGRLPGKIHLRLADEAKSFVVGTFEAEIK